MTERFPRGQTAIVSAATFGCGEAPGFSSIELAHCAAAQALASAGLQPRQVDGLFVVRLDDAMGGLTFAESLGIHPRVLSNANSGGSSFEAHVAMAALALQAGMCDVALIAYGSNQRTNGGKLARSGRVSPWETAYRPLRPISSYAMAANRHMHQYGTTREQLGEVAVAARAWARLNPKPSCATR